MERFLNQLEKEFQIMEMKIGTSKQKLTMRFSSHMSVDLTKIVFIKTQRRLLKHISILLVKSFYRTKV